MYTQRQILRDNRKQTLPGVGLSNTIFIVAKQSNVTDGTTDIGGGHTFGETAPGASGATAIPIEKMSRNA